MHGYKMKIGFGTDCDRFIARRVAIVNFRERRPGLVCTCSGQVSSPASDFVQNKAFVLKCNERDERL
ncbi:hypothetical protein AB4Z37_03755 [Bradyrhizobium sp. 2TAF24]